MADRFWGVTLALLTRETDFGGVTLALLTRKTDFEIFNWSRGVSNAPIMPERRLNKNQNKNHKIH